MTIKANQTAEAADADNMATFARRLMEDLGSCSECGEELPVPAGGEGVTEGVCARCKREDALFSAGLWSDGSPL